MSWMNGPYAGAYWITFADGRREEIEIRNGRPKISHSPTGLEIREERAPSTEMESVRFYPWTSIHSVAFAPERR